MIWVGLLSLLLMQLAAPVSSPAVPAAPGIYYLQDSAQWLALQPAVVSDADAKGMELFVHTGGYTDLGMHIACRGPRASLRIVLETPVFYVRGIGPVKDAMLVRLTEKKDSRVFKTSFSNVAVDNKGGFDRKDIVQLDASGYSDEVVSLTPEKPLPPGEYLLVFGNASKSFDFGIDRSR